MVHESTLRGGRHAALGGPGADKLRGGFGPAILAGGDGDDILNARSDNDFLHGGEGDDLLNAGGGSDILEGKGGNDKLNGHAGNDVLIGGSGADSIAGGPGNDVVLILDICELEAGEKLNGGSGMDILISPVDLATLQNLDIDVTKFEKTVVLGEASIFDCGPSCDCPTAPLPVGPEICDFSEMSTPEDASIAQSICLEVLDSLGPDFLLDAPDEPQAQDLKDFFSTFFSEHPQVVDQGTTTSFIVSGAPSPLPGHGPTGTPQPGVDTTESPCDLPAWPVLVGTGVGGFHNNCSEDEANTLRDDLDRAKFYVWRARQAVQAVIDAPNQAEAEMLWNQGIDDNQLSLAWWFGVYDPEIVAAVSETLDDVWDTLQGNWAGGSSMNVQCWHPLTWWETALFVLFAPDRIVYKMIANPCSWDWSGAGLGDDEFILAHTWYTFNPEKTVTGLFYPVWSLEVCESYFEPETIDAPDRAATLVHEFLHHTFNDYGLIRDNHSSTGLCDGPCYDEDEARALAVNAPDHAVRNNSNFQYYVRNIGTAYVEGLCDDVHQALCFPSECCGNGVRDPDEACDTDDFGDTSCADFGWSEGNLVCSPDCQSIDSSECTGSCGNGALDEANMEMCDGNDFGNKSCATYGCEGGSLTCSLACQISTENCTGTCELAPPLSYDACFVDIDADCMGVPEGCHMSGDAGHCVGGPCLRSRPDKRTEGQLDPASEFHPKGNFRDVEGNFHRCAEIDGDETTCLDDKGWGVCMKCGLGLGETMLGCQCDNDDMCGPDLYCWGKEFPNKGFCWEITGPPFWQCKSGACGQSIRDGDNQGDPAEDGGGYCEHYAFDGFGEAHCQPQRCGDVQVHNCAQQNLVCDLGGDNACTVECFSDADCQLPGWPVGMVCDTNFDRCVF